MTGDIIPDHPSWVNAAIAKLNKAGPINPDRYVSREFAPHNKPLPDLSASNYIYWSRFYSNTHWA